MSRADDAHDSRRIELVRRCQEQRDALAEEAAAALSVLPRAREFALRLRKTNRLLRALLRDLGEGTDRRPRAD